MKYNTLDPTLFKENYGLYLRMSTGDSLAVLDEPEMFEPNIEELANPYGDVDPNDELASLRDQIKFLKLNPEHETYIEKMRQEFDELRGFNIETDEEMHQLGVDNEEERYRELFNPTDDQQATEGGDDEDDEELVQERSRFDELKTASASRDQDAIVELKQMYYRLVRGIQRGISVPLRIGVPRAIRELEEYFANRS